MLYQRQHLSCFKTAHQSGPSAHARSWHSARQLFCLLLANDHYITPTVNVGYQQLFRMFLHHCGTTVPRLF